MSRAKCGRRPGRNRVRFDIDHQLEFPGGMRVDESLRMLAGQGV